MSILQNVKKLANIGVTASEKARGIPAAVKAMEIPSTVNKALKTGAEIAGQAAKAGVRAPGRIHKAGESAVENALDVVAKGTKSAISITKATARTEPVQKAVHAVSEATKKAADTKVGQVINNSVVQPVNNKIVQPIVKNTTTKPFKDVTDKEGNIQKKLSNLYTGKKINPLYVAGAGAGYLAIDNAKEGFRVQLTPLDIATRNVEYQGSPDIMMYDGVRQSSSPRNLNATGDVVLGLHNKRRG